MAGIETTVVNCCRIYRLVGGEEDRVWSDNHINKSLIVKLDKCSKGKKYACMGTFINKTQSRLGRNGISNIRNQLERGMGRGQF